MLLAFGVDEAVSVPAVVVGAGGVAVCAFHLLLEPAAQGVVGVAAVVAQLLGVALDLAAAHRYELVGSVVVQLLLAVVCLHLRDAVAAGDRKSTRLNSSHLVISYAVFCLKKKKKHH